jgi:hypothetical protein
MPTECQQAVRLIPAEEIDVPPTVPQPTPADMTSPPVDSSEVAPESAAQEEVPDRGPLDLPRIVQPVEEAEAEAAETPPRAEPAQDAAQQPQPVRPSLVPPSAVPEVPPVPAEPAAPAAEPAPEQETPVKKEPTASQSRARPQFAPVIDGPVVQPAAASATALFRAVDAALHETSSRGPTRPRNSAQPAAANLSRFISY